MLKQLLAASPVSLDTLNRPMPQTSTSAGSMPVSEMIPAPERQTDPVLLTIVQVAKLLQMNPKSVQRRIKAGVIRKVPFGGRLVRISSDELRRLTSGGLVLDAAKNDDPD